jgi:hypothetical protein
MDKPNLYFIISITDTTKFQNEYWAEAAAQFEDEYNVGVIKSGFPKDDYQLIDDINVKTSQFTEILELFVSGKVKDGDIFFFTDAWNFGIIPLAYIRKSFELNVKFIGLWGQSFFDGETFKAKQFYAVGKKGTGWAKNFEKGLLQSYDINLFPRESDAIKFRVRYFPLMVWNPVYICPWPFQYIEEARSYNWEKEDSIIVPYEPTRTIEYDMINDLKVDYPNMKFVYASKTRMSRESYLQELQKAKIMLVTPKIQRMDPVLIWEAMQYGVVPLLSTDNKLPEIGEDYRYPSAIFSRSKKVLQFIRKKERLVLIIKDILENRDEYLKMMADDLHKFSQFSNSHFRDMLRGDISSLQKVVSKAKWLNADV